MRELSEVEAMVRGLRTVLEGQRIVSVRASEPFILEKVSRRRFERTLAGDTVRRVWRRGKWVVLELARGQS